MKSLGNDKQEVEDKQETNAVENVDNNKQCCNQHLLKKCYIVPSHYNNFS